jgi:AcrR family transcriptional regulator
MIRARRSARKARQQRRARGRPEASFSARTQILDGAARVFGARGYAGTSVEHILEAANVSRRTFYRFFRNIDEVLSELFETASMMLLQAMRSAIMLGKTPEERIEYAIEVFLRAPQTVGPLSMVFHLEASNPASRLHVRREAAILEVVRLLDSEIFNEYGVHLDPLVFRGLIAAIEQISVIVYTQTDAGPADVERGKRAMIFIAKQILAASTEAPTGGAPI